MKHKKRFYGNMNSQKASEIRDKYFNQRMKQTEIAIEYGIKQGSVSRIVSGCVWQ